MYVVPRNEVESLAEVAKQNIDSANEKAKIYYKESEAYRILYENVRRIVAKEILSEFEAELKDVKCFDREFDRYIQLTLEQLKRKYLGE